jgi:quinol monooxygenase YgiN
MKTFLDKLVVASRQEEACLQYELYQSTTDEAAIIDGPLTVYKTDRLR